MIFLSSGLCERRRATWWVDGEPALLAPYCLDISSPGVGHSQRTQDGESGRDTYQGIISTMIGRENLAMVLVTQNASTKYLVSM